jgi:hypothetical protein
MDILRDSLTTCARNHTPVFEGTEGFFAHLIWKWVKSVRLREYYRFFVAERIQGAPVVSCRMKCRKTATPQPKTTAAGNTYRIAGMPMRNIAMLPKAKIAPAIPPPTATFAMLICGVRVSSFIAAPSGANLITGLNFQKFPDLSAPG